MSEERKNYILKDSVEAMIISGGILVLIGVLDLFVPTKLIINLITIGLGGSLLVVGITRYFEIRRSNHGL